MLALSIDITASLTDITTLLPIEQSRLAKYNYERKEGTTEK
jgi:hypothetical protein